MENIFAVYKPKGISSFDVIREIQRARGRRGGVGHAGTLDPLARGVLVVGVGREATKKLGEIVGKEKEYIAEIELGARSTTDDAEGEIERLEVEKHPSREDIQAIFPEFTGEIMQMPPIWSALKVGGKRAYELARKGKLDKMETRKVLVKNIELMDYSWPTLKLRVVTGPGAYIRSLARDIGEKLAGGGYLTGLERTRVGEFTKENSITPEEAAKEISKIIE